MLFVKNAAAQDEVTKRWGRHARSASRKLNTRDQKQHHDGARRSSSGRTIRKRLRCRRQYLGLPRNGIGELFPLLIFSPNFAARVITARPPNIPRRAPWSLSETNSAAVSVAPLECKKIGDFFNLGKRTEPEQGGSDTMPSSLRLARRVEGGPNSGHS